VRLPKPDCYDYVRRYYGVPAHIGVRVRVGGREGVLAQARPDQYLHIRFDGEARVSGPYHPTDDIAYLVGEQPTPATGWHPVRCECEGCGGPKGSKA
jgi:hypothetical protein